MGKKKLAPLSVFLAILLITSSEMVEEVGAKLVCDIYTTMCIGKCYKTGKCMRCCKYWGFVHGRCSLIHGMGCYCCSDDSNPGDAALRRQHHQKMTMIAPPPATFSKREPAPISSSQQCMHGSLSTVF